MASFGSYSVVCSPWSNCKKKIRMRTQDSYIYVVLRFVFPYCRTAGTVCHDLCSLTMTVVLSRCHGALSSLQFLTLGISPQPSFPAPRVGGCLSYLAGTPNFYEARQKMRTLPCFHFLHAECAESFFRQAEFSGWVGSRYWYSGGHATRPDGLVTKALCCMFNQLTGREDTSLVKEIV